MKWNCTYWPVRMIEGYQVLEETSETTIAMGTTVHLRGIERNKKIKLSSRYAFADCNKLHTFIIK